MIKRFDSEKRFAQRLISGMNLFTGSGFSIEAKDNTGKKLPTGEQLLDELKQEFSTILNFPELSKASTILEATCKEEFYTFLNKRFSVSEFDERYHVITKANILNIFSTNIDDLIYKIFQNSSDKYINNTTSDGTPYNQQNVVNYSPLHGCVHFPQKGYIFSKTKIASAYNDQRDDWNNIRKDMSNKPIIFWGWSFEDSDVIEALYSGNTNASKNSEKWMLLYSPEDYEIKFYEALGFKIIIGDTVSFLEKLEELSIHVKSNMNSTQITLPEYSIPKNITDVPSYPLISFFEGDSPRWSHIFSSSVIKTHYFTNISDILDANKNVFVIGIPACGKSTLMMQLLYEYPSDKPKHYMDSPSIKEVELYVNKIKHTKTLLFVDNCFRDVYAVINLLKSSNIQSVFFDRDYLYESQAYKIRSCCSNFEIRDITEITDQDSRKIIDSIPGEIKKQNTTIDVKDKTIFSILTRNMKKQRFEIRFRDVVDDFYKTNPIATELFIMICYVHSCGVPVSYDMIYSYLKDITSDYTKVYDYIVEMGKIVLQCSDDSFAFLNVNLNEQDYYQSRSRYFADLIIKNLPNNSSILAKVLNTFVNNVPAFKICRFDVFKRTGFDSDYAIKAFPDIADGEKYYEKCALIDETEYIYQQAALYFSKKKKYSTAFQWIERARNFSGFNRFSIDNTHATIQFNANISIEDNTNDGSVENLLNQSLDILQNCYTNDRRKSIHVKTFSTLCIEYYNRYGYKKSITYLEQARNWLEIELKNIDTGRKRKNEMEKLYHQLEDILNAI